MTTYPSDETTETDIVNNEVTETDFLFCKQRIDQESPELWPEQIPGVTEFSSTSIDISQVKPVLNETFEKLNQQKLDKKDLEMIHELSNLTVTQIMERLQALKNQTYQLGLQESKEMTRGKFLNVLGRKRKR